MVGMAIPNKIVRPFIKQLSIPIQERPKNNKNASEIPFAPHFSYYSEN
jgi:hypothetical protein